MKLEAQTEPLLTIGPRHLSKRSWSDTAKKGWGRWPEFLVEEMRYCKRRNEKMLITQREQKGKSDSRKVEQKKGKGGESSRWGRIEESLRNERTSQKLPITPILTSPPRFHNHSFLVTKFLRFSTYPDKVRQRKRTGAAVVLTTMSSPTPSEAQKICALSS